MDSVVDMMQKGVDDNVFPGAVLLVSVDSEIVFYGAFGKSDIYLNEDMTKHTVFDLASLTKPLATTMAVMKLVQDGEIFPDQSLGSFVNPCLSDLSDLPFSSVINNFSQDALAQSFNNKKDITIDELLRHTSGLPAYKHYYKSMMELPCELRRKCLRAMLVMEPLICFPGANQLYSDLGYIFLAWIVEIVTGLRLDHFLKQYIYSVLGIEDLFFPGLPAAVASDESLGMRNFDVMSCCTDHMNYKIKNDGFGEKGKCERRFASSEYCPWRRKVLIGEVHDDNAWAAGGIEGHAGLFGTAFGVFMLLEELMKGLKGEKTRVISGSLLKQFLLKHGDKELTAGFDTPSRPMSSSGRYFSDSSIGHLGFTGTSFWMDPEKSVIVILLTNRVHPKRENEKIKWFRPLIHDIVMEEFVL